MSTLTPRILNLLALGLLAPSGVRDDGWSSDPDDEGIGFGDDCSSPQIARDGSLIESPVFGWDDAYGENADEYAALVELGRDGSHLSAGAPSFGDEYDDYNDDDDSCDFGDDDELGDDDEYGFDDDEFGGREERRDRRAIRKRQKARRLNNRASQLDPDGSTRRRRRRRPQPQPKKRKVILGATVISGTDTLTGAGTATVRIRLQHDFIAKDITFEGSTAGTKITSIMFADRSVWSNPDGVPFGTFGVSGFLRGLLKGQRASRGVDITITGTLTGAGDLVATLTGGKPIQRVC